MTIYSFERQRTSEDLFIPVTRPEPICVSLCLDGHEDKCLRSLHTDLGYRLRCCCRCHELEKLTK
jgi:hypothetical protein